MKRNIILFVAATVALLLAASCNRKVEYQFESYATLYNSSYAVAENVGELRIPVLVNNTNGADVQISVKVNEGKALDGVDYEVVSPANGLLSFTGETDSLDVVIKIIAFEGEFTGAKDFSVNITSATEGLSVGTINSANVIIQDLDHPLSLLAGQWEGTLQFASDPPTPMPTVLDITIDENDETFTKIFIEGLEANYASYAAGYAITAYYNSETATISIPAGQVGMFVSSSYDFRLVGLDESWSNLINIEFKYNPTNDTLTLMNDYAMLDNKSGELYSAYNLGAVFTKK